MHGTSTPLGFFGWPAPILGFMEQQQIYNTINFGLPMYTTTFWEQTSATATATERGPLGNVANTTAAFSQPMSFVCPSSTPRNNPGQANNQQKDYSDQCGHRRPRIYPVRLSGSIHHRGDDRLLRRQ